MPSVRKTPSLSPEGRLRVLHTQRDRRQAECNRIESEFNRTYPKMHYLEVLAWKAYIDVERAKLNNVLKAIEKFRNIHPEPERQMKFGRE